MGSIQFGAPRSMLTWMRQQFGLKTFVETGTNKANTTVWAAEKFERVYTVEGYEPLYRAAIEKYGSIPNIQFLYGNSPDRLAELVPTLKEPAVFWLDAHWCGPETSGQSAECPVIAELDVLNASELEHILLIDDARLFLAPPPPPHVASHWPSIDEVCRHLSAHPSNRYVCVFQDVIVAVPASHKTAMIDYVRSQPREEATPPKASWLRSKASRVRQILTK